MIVATSRAAGHTWRFVVGTTSEGENVQSTVKSDATAAGVAVPRVPTGLFIGGEWRDAADGATFDAVAPSTEEHLATIAAAGAADIDAAVAAARAQADGGAWSRMSGAERGKLLYRL